MELDYDQQVRAEQEWEAKAKDVAIRMAVEDMEVAAGQVLRLALEIADKIEENNSAPLKDELWYLIRTSRELRRTAKALAVYGQPA